MSHEPFIGIGHNPEGPDLPLGLGMNLAQDPSAMKTFAKMSPQQKSHLIHYIQGAHTGNDAKNRLSTAMHSLHDGHTDIS